MDIPVKDIVTMVGTIIGVPGALFAAYKTVIELRRTREQRVIDNEQRIRETQRRRAEFTLTQHRRLFDDPVLFSVLKKLDDNHPDLATDEMWDAKRKFLTFFEELYLLMQSGLVDRNTAFYVFAYYAVFAKTCSNFNVRIEYRQEYWGLYLLFVAEAEKYMQEFNPESLDRLTL